jgi:SAM-dependent methyltransferase
MVMGLGMKEHSDNATICPVCGTGMTAQIEACFLFCSSCQFWRALPGDCDQMLRGESAVVEERRYAGLIKVRMLNNEVILDRLARCITVAGARILDVGCSYGWFLKSASKRGAIPLGIEPEESVARKAIADGNNVRVGYFPVCMEPDEVFDVIVFNDVLEHLPDVAQILRSCHVHLRPGGILAVNIPVSSGVIFRVATILAKAGIKGAYYRLWQKGFRSPHLSYFNGENLAQLCGNSGFKPLSQQRLKTVALDGLWARLTMDGRRSMVVAALSYAALLLLWPVLAFLAPADLMLYLFERTEMGG